MIKKSILFFIITIIMFSCDNKKDKEYVIPSNFVHIKGGTFTNRKSDLYGKNLSVSDFLMAKNEVSQQEWIDIMGNNPSHFKGDSLPVEMVTWYECITYCIKRSIQEGIEPYYIVDKNKKDPDSKSEYDSLRWSISVNSTSPGYRLPTEVEWQYAASGGQLSKSYTFSGSDKIGETAWYWRNCGDSYLPTFWKYSILVQNNCRTHPICTKKPNELGLYDMSGNVREWCADWFLNSEIRTVGIERSVRGGGWIGIEDYCSPFMRNGYESVFRGQDQGLRVCRNL